jgi:hypothetical protein
MIFGMAIPFFGAINKLSNQFNSSLDNGDPYCGIRTSVLSIRITLAMKRHGKLESLCCSLGKGGAVSRTNCVTKIGQVRWVGRKERLDRQY